MALMKTVLSIGIAVIVAALVIYSFLLLEEEIIPRYEYKNYPTSASSTAVPSPTVAMFRNFLPFAPTIIGIILIALGIFLKKYEGIGSGIMGGGVLIIIFSFSWAFFSAERYVRILLLAVALIVLIWFGYKKLEKGDILKK